MSRSVPNVHEPDYDEPREEEGFRALRARIGRQAGGERLGASLWLVEPGQAYERCVDGGGLRLLFRIEQNVDYYDGERPPQMDA